MHEIAGNCHMHTPYSDGIKWHQEIAEDAIRAGLDFIIVTDHNVWVDGVERYYENEQGKVLLLVGEEVHDMRRHPQVNHFLVYGAEREMCRYAPDPQRLIEETCIAGGYGFLAHPFDPPLPAFHEPDYPWLDWQVEGFTGLEIWNYMSEFKGHIKGKLSAVQVALRPEKYIMGPDVQVLAKWDELLAQGKRIAAVGNSDAHGQTFSLGPVRRVLFPYEFLFRAVNTHLLIPRPLNGDVAHDKRLILDGLGRGRGWVGYDMPHPTKGFRFTGQGSNKGVMGDDVKLDAGATLQVKAPAACHIRLIRHGQVVAEAKNDRTLTHIPVDPGAYRVECYLPYLDKKRGWIFSNPIYLR
jgi:hypothetical protein